MDHEIPSEVQDLANKIELAARAITGAVEARMHAPDVSHYWHWCAERDKAQREHDGLVKLLRDQGWVLVDGELQKKEES